MLVNSDKIHILADNINQKLIYYIGCICRQIMNKEILVIDDDLGTRSFLKHMLKSMFEVKACSDGYEAIQWLEDGNFPDLIISDLFMPGLHGIDLVKFVRGSGFYRKTNFILLTGNEDESMENMAYEAGVTLYLQKPFEPRTLLYQVVNLLKDKHHVRNNNARELITR